MVNHRKPLDDEPDRAYAFQAELEVRCATPFVPRLDLRGARAKEWEKRERSRRLVPRGRLDDRGRFEKLRVVPTRFVRACPRGHVDDIDWHWFVYGAESGCPRSRQLWLDERGTNGDLSDLVVRCECGASRRLSDATQFEMRPLHIALFTTACWIPFLLVAYNISFHRDVVLDGE